MKIRDGFVSNSSSTAFMILNKANEKKTLVDFVKENPQLIQQFRQEYDWYKNNECYTQEGLIISAEQEKLTWNPKENQYCIFGDEQNTVVGTVFDYVLRDGGESESFTWEFEEFLR